MVLSVRRLPPTSSFQSRVPRLLMIGARALSSSLRSLSERQRSSGRVVAMRWRVEGWEAPEVDERSRFMSCGRWARRWVRDLGVVLAQEVIESVCRAAWEWRIARREEWSKKGNDDRVKDWRFGSRRRSRESHLVGSLE